jgi:3-phosphoshikimate 1-carboxyvinyltransferase
VETLRIKETDRIGALRDELAKVGVAVHPIRGEGKEAFQLSGLAHWDHPPVFATYEDHRMAMAFAPLALVHPICIADPGVVEKSYPDFWKDLEKLGFRVA